MRSKLFEFISRKNDEESPKISAIIINPKTGEPDYAKMVESENMNTPRTFADRLFGRTLTKDYETNNIDEKGNADIQTHRASHTRGGLISDFIKGYEENYNDDFNINNLRGAKKSIANRIGEGLGTITRGLAGGLGDSYIAGVYGLPAAMQRQNLRVGDKLYRNQLESQGVDTGNIRGFITDDVYKNIALNNYRNNSLALKSNIANAKDNTTRAKMIGDWLKNGQLSPEDAKVLIAQYGLTNADFQLSNETRKADSQIALNTQRGEKLESDINVNNAILGGADVVRVIAPSGQIGTIPSENLENALKAGYKRL